MSPKPGIMTSEFWLTAAAALAGFLLSSGAVAPGSPLVSVLGLVSSTLACLGYTASRAYVKSR